MLHKWLLFFAAGCVGGLANSVVVWLCGEYGVTAALDVAIAPSLHPAWLYPRIVWGGLWGLAFVLPLSTSRLWQKCLLISVLPTLVQLFVVFPYKAGKGMAGLELGLWTPLFVIGFNAVWGLVTGYVAKWAR